MTELGALRLDEVLDRLESPAPGPAGASAAALAAAMAASLVVMTACGTDAWADGRAVAERASQLRGRLVELADEDAQAVARLLELFREPVSDGRAEKMASGLVEAAKTPLAIAVAAAELTELAGAAAEQGKPVMRADAAAAAQLAEAATRAAVLVVETNLAAIPRDAVAPERDVLSRRASDALTRVTER